MNIYEYTLDEATEEIDNFCYNWNIIRICHGLWKHEIIEAYGGKKELHEIAGVGVNYINEICACKVNRENCKRTFNAVKSSGILPYVRGTQKITEITTMKKYIVLNIVYNDLVDKKRRVKHLCNIKSDRLEEAEKRLEQINEWLGKNYKGRTELKDYLDDLKEKIMEQIESLPKLAGSVNCTPIGKIKNYLLGKYAESITTDKQHGCLVETARLLIELDCDMIASFSDEKLEILEGNVQMLSRRIKAERDYRTVRKEERLFARKYTEGADEKYMAPKNNTVEDSE